jgi:hypothetical protein
MGGTITFWDTTWSEYGKTKSFDFLRYFFNYVEILTMYWELVVL